MWVKGLDLRPFKDEGVGEYFVEYNMLRRSTFFDQIILDDTRVKTLLQVHKVEAFRTLMRSEHSIATVEPKPQHIPVLIRIIQTHQDSHPANH